MVKHPYMRATGVAFGLALVTTVAMGCQHEHRSRTAGDQTQTRTTVATTGPRVDNVTLARDSIVAARCDREERCDRVGSGRDYETPAACADKFRARTDDDLNTDDCPKGVDQPKLSNCLAKIRSENCENVLDALSRFDACRTGTICI